MGEWIVRKGTISGKGKSNLWVHGGDSQELCKSFVKIN
jgi:hypothetical protein